MKRHLQCAEQQVSTSNLTKYCACHAKWLSRFILLTYETSFTMRGAIGIALQPHQILRLPRKSALQNLSEILRERLKRQFQCAADSTTIRPWSDHELVISHPPVRRGYFSRFGDAFCIENYNISRSGYLSKFHQTLCLPRKVTLPHHQVLRLPRKMTLMIDLRHIWNVIYNARSNRHHPPTSPNTAPATQNDSHDWSSSHIWNVIYNARSNRHHPPTSPNTAPATQKCTPKSKRNSPRTVEAPIPMRGRFDHDPNMIRTWSEHELVISHPPVRRGYFSRFGDAFCIENYNISRSGYLLKFHRILRLPRKVTLRHHQILRLPRKVTLRHHQMLRLPRKVTLRHHQILRLPRKVTLRHHQILRLPRKVTLRHHQILRLPRKVRLLLNCYWTELLLSCYWAVTKLLLSCYWTVTDTELTCYWAVTELNCYWTVTQLLLNWPVTELSCYSTVTGLLLNCYWTDLLLNWAVTQLLLDCYWTDLLLSCYWTVTLHCYLNCYCTGLFAFLNLRNSEVSQLNFLWICTCIIWSPPKWLMEGSSRYNMAPIRAWPIPPIFWFLLHLLRGKPTIFSASWSKHIFSNDFTQILWWIIGNDDLIL